MYGTDVQGAVVRNRGLGNEGLYLEGGKDYEGYFFARSLDGASIVVSLEDYTRSTPDGLPIVLSSVVLTVPAGSKWSRLNYSLPPLVTGTTCDGIEPGSDPTVSCGNFGPQAGHICVKCGGQLAIRQSSRGSVNLDFVFLQPGAWGRLQGLPVQLRAVQMLQEMGVTAIRQGGSFVRNSRWNASDPAEYYFWKRWRGPPEQRPSHNLTWGQSLIGGWGPFELIQMCEAAGFEPIFTTFTWGVKPSDMADMVEYLYGDNTTEYGALRTQDGHPAPYRTKYIGLGNERYNQDYVLLKL